MKFHDLKTEFLELVAKLDSGGGMSEAESGGHMKTARREPWCIEESSRGGIGEPGPQTSPEKLHVD
jgi:hypothetical protein